MPRIDPVQLLKCLSVLLDSSGGIKSQDEVQRLASLMTKFSKKLVSKCIYIHILKQTKTDLLGLFMGAGGWTLTHVWLTECILAKNGALVKELLELLLVCPVDVDRLKSNNCPKLVKDLSKDAFIEDIRTLASKLVEQWLKIVKGETTVPLTLAQVNKILSPPESADIPEKNAPEEQKENHAEPEVSNVARNSSFEFISVNEVNDDTNVEPNEEINSKINESIPILKISVKDGKQVISKVDESISDKKQCEGDNNSLISDSITSDIKHKAERTKSKDKNRDKHRSSSNHKSSRSSKSSSKHLKSSSDISDKSNSSHNKITDISHSKSSKSSSKDSKSLDKLDKVKHKDDKDRNIEKQKDKHSEKRKDKSNNKNKEKEIDKNDGHKSSTSEKQIKEKEVKVKEQTEKNKETLKKLQPISLNKLGKIPKRPLEETAKDKIEIKREKPSLSIEVRKPNDANRPKTVKMFHSKFRSHGLEEEASKPPPRGMVKKSTAPLAPPVILPMPKMLSSPIRKSSPPPKRTSPPPILDIPPEKKIKVAEHVDKPGAIKLIPPKPKPAYLLESDMFMDALTASATNKKEPKKRKRRTSGSKDGASTSDASPPTTPTDLNEKAASSSAPPRFYQDTLQTEDDNKVNDNVFENKETKSPDINEVHKESPNANLEEIKINEVQSPDQPAEKVVNPSGLKSVLIYHKRTGPKKSLRWRPDDELEEIQYFELDETERVNVTKTFLDLMHLDRLQERETFRKARNLTNEDTMEEKMSWRPLIIVDTDATYVEYGKNSKEKDIQAAREKSILPALYFHKSVIPESPCEPDLENHPTTDPTIIPLEDKGENDSINDYRNTPWPEPKLTPIQPIPNGMPLPPIFPNMPPFPPGFPPNPQFGIPGFPNNPPMMGGDWSNGPPGMLLPPEAMNMGPEMFPTNGPMFPGPMPPNGFGMIENMNGPMFHPRFPAPMPGVPVMPIPGVPNGPFNVNVNNNNNRGGIRNMGPRNQNPHWRQKGPGSWNAPGSRRKLCTYFQTKNSCRQGENCQFLHPGVNCPL